MFSFREEVDTIINVMNLKNLILKHFSHCSREVSKQTLKLKIQDQIQILEQHTETLLN